MNENLPLIETVQCHKEQTQLITETNEDFEDKSFEINRKAKKILMKKLLFKNNSVLKIILYFIFSYCSLL